MAIKISATVPLSISRAKHGLYKQLTKWAGSGHGSVWTPTVPVVYNYGLAFCDRESLGRSDLIAVDRPSPLYTGEVYYQKFAPSQRFYWLKHQRCDELSLFMTYDSDLAAQGLNSGQ